jgi:capsular exopolysaccharide synthesis family protein
MAEVNVDMPGGGDDIIEIDLQDVFRRLVKHRLTIFTVLFVAVAGSLIYSFTAEPVYQAKSRVMVDRRPPKIVKVEDMIIPDYTDPTNFFNSQVEILKSQTLASLVFQELGTYEPTERRGKSAGELNPFTDNERLEALLKHVKISPVRMTQIIDVSVEDTDPQLAARIANIWTQAYVLFSSVDQLLQRRSELETDLYQRSKYLKGKNPIILGLQSEIEAIHEKIKSEGARLSQEDVGLTDILAWRGDASNVQIIDRAQVPIKPIRPRKALNLVLAVILGLFAGGALVFVLESSDQTIKTTQDLEQAVKMSCLVAIPHFKNKNAPKDLVPELISEKSRRSLVAESFRHLRTGIIFSNPDFPKKTIMVTSSSALEGKSTTAINLAIVFAQAGERTILVDTDMRSPRLHAIFKTDRPGGLTEILAYDKGDAQSFIHKTGIPNLDILACGAVPPNPSELLGSKKMEEFIAKLQRDYDRVIFDSPPILAATDAAILSTKVDATILVVRSGFAHRQAVSSSVKALKAVNARVLAVVLNMVDFYGQGHHYGYSLYEPNTRKKIAAKTKTKGSVKKSA